MSKVVLWTTEIVCAFGTINPRVNPEMTDGVYGEIIIIF